MDEILNDLREGRLYLAHPKTIYEDDDEPPTPLQLQQVVADCYKSKKEFCRQLNQLIDHLDIIFRDLERPILG